MELLHVLGNTYAAVAATALLPVYKLNDRDVVLIDTGYAKLDRAGLTALIDGSGWHLRAILCSHAHFDHTGNVRYLQQRYGAPAAISLIEAGISVNPDSYRANYVALTYGKSREIFLEECFTADRVIFPQEDHIDVDGARFGVLSLPGHSAGQLGFVTPDGAAYLGDCLIDQHEIDAAKLPTSMFIARDLESKASLRSTDYPAYIVAHKQIITDRAELSALIDSNIAFIHRKERELLDDLTDGMTFSDWIYAFCQRENIRTRQELKFSIVERNFTNFTDWLKARLSPRITRHGVLVEVYGEGILILGDSGIGKSELAIELVKRGHRLVADDAVELRKVSNRQIMGTAPENIRHFIELRGIGIVNVARVYGVGAVKLSESLDLVVQLEARDPTKNYQRTGLESEYYDILGVSIPSTSIPVSPGRNLAVVLETAAINNRQKKMGYNAAKELLIRLGLDDKMD